MKKSNLKSVTILRIAIQAIVTNPVILFPMCVLAFIQLLALELISFMPRFPLSVFFDPIVRYFWGEVYLHYPFNFVLLPKLFHFAQVFIYIMVGGFLTGVTVLIIEAINNNRKVFLKAAFKQALKSYISIFLAAFVSWGMMWSLGKVHSLIFQRALVMRSETGLFGLLKKSVVLSAPYVQLFIGVVVTAIFLLVIPIIVLDKKKFLPSLKQNFWYLKDSFMFLFMIILIPTLFYLPVFVVRNVVVPSAQMSFPEIHAIIIILSIVMALFIDAVIMTATTTYYLAKKENT